MRSLTGIVFLVLFVGCSVEVSRKVTLPPGVPIGSLDQAKSYKESREIKLNTIASVFKGVKIDTGKLGSVISIIEDKTVSGPTVIGRAFADTEEKLSEIEKSLSYSLEESDIKIDLSQMEIEQCWGPVVTRTENGVTEHKVFKIFFDGKEAPEACMSSIVVKINPEHRSKLYLDKVLVYSDEMTEEEFVDAYSLLNKKERKNLVDRFARDSDQTLSWASVYEVLEDETYGSDKIDLIERLLFKRLLDECKDTDLPNLLPYFNYDSDKKKVIGDLSHTCEISGEGFVQIVDSLTFGSDRKEALEILSHSFEAISGDNLVRILRSINYDSDRIAVFSMILGSAHMVTLEHFDSVMNMMTFGSDKLKIIREFAKWRTKNQLTLTSSWLQDRLRSISYDSDKLQALQIWMPVQFDDAEETAKIIRIFTFDSDKINALKIIAPYLEEFAKPNFEMIRKIFSSDSKKIEAMEILGY